jgi:hypothetical protein
LRRLHAVFLGDGEYRIYGCGFTRIILLVNQPAEVRCATLLTATVFPREQAAAEGYSP